MKRVKLTIVRRYDLTDEERHDLADALDLSLHHLRLDLVITESRRTSRGRPTPALREFRALIQRQEALLARMTAPGGQARRKPPSTRVSGRSNRR